MLIEQLIDKKGCLQKNKTDSFSNLMLKKFLRVKFEEKIFNWQTYLTKFEERNIFKKRLKRYCLFGNKLLGMN